MRHAPSYHHGLDLKSRRTLTKIAAYIAIPILAVLACPSDGDTPMPGLTTDGGGLPCLESAPLPNESSVTIRTMNERKTRDGRESLSMRFLP
jgi:hypothetical protein